MSLFDPPQEQIVTNTLEVVAKFTRIIQELVTANRLLQESLALSVKELKKLREKAKADGNKAIA